MERSNRKLRRRTESRRPAARVLEQTTLHWWFQDTDTAWVNQFPWTTSKSRQRAIDPHTADLLAMQSIVAYSRRHGVLTGTT